MRPVVIKGGLKTAGEWSLLGTCPWKMRRHKSKLSLRKGWDWMRTQENLGNGLFRGGWETTEDPEGLGMNGLV